MKDADSLAKNHYRIQRDMKEPSVLVIDDEYRSALYEMWLRPHCNVIRATSYEEVKSQMTKSVCVVLLRHELSENMKTKVQRLVESVAPHSRFAVTTSEHHEIAFPDIDCDLSLYEPITEEDVVEAVDRLLGRALYLDALADYYRLTVRATSYEITDHKESGEAHAKQLQKQLDGLSAYLDRLKKLLDADDLRAVLKSLETDEELPEPASEEPTSPMEKYRPSRCSQCRVSWGPNQSSMYSSLGAFTWKCKQCGHVQNIPSPSDRTIAR